MQFGIFSLSPVHMRIDNTIFKRAEKVLLVPDYAFIHIEVLEELT